MESERPKLPRHTAAGPLLLDEQFQSTHHPGALALGQAPAALRQGDAPVMGRERSNAERSPCLPTTAAGQQLGAISSHHSTKPPLPHPAEPVFDEQRLHAYLYRLLTLKEAAAYLHIHPETLRRLAKVGTVPSCKIGRRWVFRLPDLYQFVGQQQERKEEQCPSTNAAKSGGYGSPRQVANSYARALGLPTK